MKKLIKHIAIIFLLFSATLFSQEIPKKSTETKQSTESKVETNAKNSEEVKPIIDNNLNGIDDKNENPKSNNLQDQFQTRKRSQQHFKDEDGDGINDNRCKGLGLGKGKGRKAGKRK